MTLPLRWKLVALHALIVAFAMAGFCVLLTVRLQKALVQAVDEELVGRARALGVVAEIDQGAWIIEKKSGLDEEYGLESGLYYVLEDGTGKRAPASPLARSLGLGIAETDGAGFVQAAGRRFREVTLTVTKSQEEDEPEMRGAVVRVTCGKDAAAVDLPIQALVRQLAIVGPLVLLFSLLGGLFIAGRALSPIGRMARRAEEIGARHLSLRLDERGRDELAGLAKTLNRAFDRLQEAIERQARFTADASHELRTPLSLVAGNVELALKKPRSPEEHREFLEGIQEATRRMGSIVEGLLTLARAEAGELPIDRSSVSLNALCDDCVRLHRPLAAHREVALAVEVAGELGVRGDLGRLKELLSNLVTNAILYNRKGGRVVVRASQGEGRIRIEVEDTGIGIPGEDLPHVFERFYRVDKARSPEVGGSGLGLAIAKSIVDAHGGSIGVSSKVGEGSSFVVSLPA